MIAQLFCFHIKLQSMGLTTYSYITRQRQLASRKEEKGRDNCVAWARRLSRRDWTCRQFPSTFLCQSRGGAFGDVEGCRGECMPCPNVREGRGRPRFAVIKDSFEGSGSKDNDAKDDDAVADPKPRRGRSKAVDEDAEHEPRDESIEHTLTSFYKTTETEGDEENYPTDCPIRPTDYPTNYPTDYPTDRPWDDSAHDAEEAVVRGRQGDEADPSEERKSAEKPPCRRSRRGVARRPRNNDTSGFWEEEVPEGALPPEAERLPQSPEEGTAAVGCDISTVSSVEEGGASPGAGTDGLDKTLPLTDSSGDALPDDQEAEDFQVVDWPEMMDGQEVEWPSKPSNDNEQNC
uniref:Uncharacterized protein n=1 Tax=Corethron hystrix TaxID=216773 RepID=A0A7S1BPA1_9STRA|mmetsp:Transcript_34303/g.79318  ORF Transcript_34303/g.79318 Transcript_34303/m.79318 type:complete len:347 (+) Transcript_34303:195-1235(+)